MINSRTKAEIEKARADGIKFGRNKGSQNKTTPEKHAKIRIFLRAHQKYDWIAKELSVSKKTIAAIKGALPKG